MNCTECGCGRGQRTGKKRKTKRMDKQKDEPKRDEGRISTTMACGTFCTQGTINNRTPRGMRNGSASEGKGPGFPEKENEEERENEGGKREGEGEEEREHDGKVSSLDREDGRVINKIKHSC